MVFFYKNLSYLRKQKGLTQSQLSDYLEVKQTNINNWERNKNYPNTEKLIDISRFFDINIDDLLTLDLSNVQLRNFNKTNGGTKYKGKSTVESIVERTAAKEKKPKKEYKYDERGMPQVGDNILDYQAQKDPSPEWDATQAMFAAFEAIKDFKKTLGQLKERDDSERVESFKAAFEAEKRNRQLLEEKIKLMERERSENTQKKNDK